MTTLRLEMVYAWFIDCSAAQSLVGASDNIAGNGKHGPASGLPNTPATSCYLPSPPPPSCAKTLPWKGRSADPDRPKKLPMSRLKWLQRLSGNEEDMRSGNSERLCVWPALRRALLMDGETGLLIYRIQELPDVNWFLLLIVIVQEVLCPLSD